MQDKSYIVIVQCYLVKQRCSGYYCEKAFFQRTGGFTDYPKESNYRTLYMTCGGCCGRATHRKLSNLVKQIKKRENLDKESIVVHLSSCITKDNYHGPPCPHLEYLEKLIDKLGLDIKRDTSISDIAEKRRKEGVYSS
ncbi:CGGC domain-containing protein [Candidatus Latescibacterota bacterium]